MRVLRYDKKLRRVWVCKRRLHHGLVGFILCTGGIVLMRHDRRDFPWLKDLP